MTASAPHVAGCTETLSSPGPGKPLKEQGGDAGGETGDGRGSKSPQTVLVVAKAIGMVGCRCQLGQSRGAGRPSRQTNVRAVQGGPPIKFRRFCHCHRILTVIVTQTRVDLETGPYEHVHPRVRGWLLPILGNVHSATTNTPEEVGRGHVWGEGFAFLRTSGASVHHAPPQARPQSKTKNPCSLR